MDRYDRVWIGSRGMEDLGVVGSDMAGMDRQVREGSGGATQSRIGEFRQGLLKHGEAGMVRFGFVCFGIVRIGSRGKVRYGLARHSMVWKGS